MVTAPVGVGRLIDESRDECGPSTNGSAADTP